MPLRLDGNLLIREIVFTRGLLQKLNKSEIESVAAHELTHIINKDSLLMLIAVVYIGAIAML